MCDAVKAACVRQMCFLLKHLKQLQALVLFDKDQQFVIWDPLVRPKTDLSILNR